MRERGRVGRCVRQRPLRLALNRSNETFPAVRTALPSRISPQPVQHLGRRVRGDTYMERSSATLLQIGKERGEFFYEN